MSTLQTIISSPDDTTITLIERFEAPIERVFRALTSPRDMEAWVWGGIGTDAQAEVDLRPGGRYSVSIDAGVTDTDWPRSRWAMKGLYLRVDAPTRLIYTVHWDAPVGYNQGADAIDEVVTIQLIDRGDQTELHYVHIGVPTSEAARAHQQAIAHTFQLLRTHLAESKA